MTSLSEMYINKAIHNIFSTLCASRGNAKMKDVDRLFDSEEMVSLAAYLAPLIRCKSYAQWQGRALALQLPSEAVLATRSAGEAIKLIALEYISTCKAGDPISANLKPRDHLIDAELTTWMSQ